MPWYSHSYCILILGYCNGISKEIDEAACIDGASFFKAYTTIMLQVMKPIHATTGTLAFCDAWNNYMMPLAFNSLLAWACLKRALTFQYSNGYEPIT